MAGKTIVFYHLDLDGYASAWAMSVALRNSSNVEYIGIQYGDKIPYEKFAHADGEFNMDHVYFVDFMPLMEDIEKLSSMVLAVTIIDHHAGRIPEVEKMKTAEWMVNHPNVTVVFQDGVAGCVLTWKHMMPSNPVPLVLEMAQEFDLWKKDRGLHPDVLNELMLNPANRMNWVLWDYLGSFDLKKLQSFLESAPAWHIYNNKLNLARNYAKHKAVVVKRWGKNIAVGNVVSDIPLTVAEMSKREDVDFAMGFFVLQSHVVFSFRSCKDSVLPYAQELGGNGHEMACGAHMPLQRGLEFLQSLLQA